MADMDGLRSRPGSVEAWPAGRSTSSTRLRVVAESAAATVVATRLPIRRGTRPMIATTSGLRTAAAARLAWVSRVTRTRLRLNSSSGVSAAASRAWLAGQHRHLAKRLARPHPREHGHLSGRALEERLDESGLDDVHGVARLALTDDQAVRGEAAPLELLDNSPGGLAGDATKERAGQNGRATRPRDGFECHGSPARRSAREPGERRPELRRRRRQTSMDAQRRLDGTGLLGQLEQELDVARVRRQLLQHFERVVQ
jgi:hypothetical protein